MKSNTLWYSCFTMRAQEGMHEVEYIAVALMPSTPHTQGTASHHTHIKESSYSTPNQDSLPHTTNSRDWRIDLDGHIHSRRNMKCQSLSTNCMMFRPCRPSSISYKAGLYKVDKVLRG